MGSRFVVELYDPLIEKFFTEDSKKQLGQYESEEMTAEKIVKIMKQVFPVLNEIESSQSTDEEKIKTLMPTLRKFLGNFRYDENWSKEFDKRIKQKVGENQDFDDISSYAIFDLLKRGLDEDYNEDNKGFVCRHFSRFIRAFFLAVGVRSKLIGSDELDTDCNSKHQRHSFIIFPDGNIFDPTDYVIGSDGYAREFFSEIKSFAEYKKDLKFNDFYLGFDFDSENLDDFKQYFKVVDENLEDCLTESILIFQKKSYHPYFSLKKEFFLNKLFYNMDELSYLKNFDDNLQKEIFKIFCSFENSKKFITELLNTNLDSINNIENYFTKYNKEKLAKCNDEAEKQRMKQEIIKGAKDIQEEYKRNYSSLIS